MKNLHIAGGSHLEVLAVDSRDGNVLLAVGDILAHRLLRQELRQQ
jgi:hypothetical protein